MKLGYYCSISLAPVHIPRRTVRVKFYFATYPAFKISIVSHENGNFRLLSFLIVDAFIVHTRYVQLQRLFSTLNYLKSKQKHYFKK